MQIGFATPVSLELLRDAVRDGEKMPTGYVFGPSAAWIKELMRLGHHVVVYTTATQIQASETYYGKGLTIRIAACRGWGTGRDFWAPERHELERMMREDRCEVIHAHWTYEFALAALATGIPTLVTIHDLPWRVLSYFRDPHRLARLMMAYVVAYKAKYFTAVSQDAANHFRRFLNPFAKITIVPNGLPEAFFAEQQNDEGTVREHCVYATILQGWSRRKNPIAALKAFGMVLERVPEAKLMMFGYDYQPGGPAHQWACSHGLDRNVTFVGSLPYDELIKRVRNDVDVIVHPSLDESFCMAAVEGMALKKPVIAGKSTPGVREVLDYGRSGVLVDVTSPHSIYVEMQKFANDRDYREKQGDIGYIHAKFHYKNIDVVRRYENEYRSLLINYYR